MLHFLLTKKSSCLSFDIYTIVLWGSMTHILTLDHFIWHTLPGKITDVTKQLHGEEHGVPFNVSKTLDRSSQRFDFYLEESYDVS